MIRGKCKLCHKIKKLCKKSHIIPNHAYKILKNENNEMVYVQNVDSKSKIKVMQTGEFESKILCQDCENLLSGFETYGVNLINNKIVNIHREEQIKQDGFSFLKISGQGYKYREFKLYLLSILWKASISSRNFFRSVSLGEENEEVLRKMILAGNPGEEYEYPCHIILPAFTTNGVCGMGFDLNDVGLIKNPETFKKDSITFVKFLIDGCLYLFAITRESETTKFYSVHKNYLLILFSTLEQTLNQRINIFNTLIELAKD